MRAIRTLIFFIAMAFAVLVWGTAITVAWILPHRYRCALLPSFGRTFLWLLKVLCDVDYTVEGRHNIATDRACVVMLKHSSVWETLAELVIFPRQVIVLKRELMWVPILGWALASIGSISINRRAGRSAVKQVLEQGKAHLAQGTWVMIFPEGTRVNAGQVGRFGRSGPMLAIEAGVPVLPVAHNAEDHWPNGKFLKRPGTITMRVGTPIDSSGKSVEELSNEVRTWMLNNMQEISSSHSETNASSVISAP